MDIALTPLILLVSLSHADLLSANERVPDNELLLNKVCPVSSPMPSLTQASIGILAFSQHWYHDGGDNAAYQARDNATGVGIEIHFLANDNGFVKGRNVANCQRYRIIQLRQTNIKNLVNELPVQIDIPNTFSLPFYDNHTLEHGHGMHKTPKDNQDKPWAQSVMRASSVAIYDTPYVSDAYGTEGEDIRVTFETCVVCQREQGFDQLLSCGSWGFQRDYMGGMTGWAEPEFIPVQCSVKPSDQYLTTLDNAERIDYRYWLDWR
ncbi:MAG: hypothetical protein HRT97_07095 [Moritella sp.]|uniref:hypothetical protein n=1 Tax=Moritella sp. TaxID=78556 RepID=UPI0025E96E52|nr:hypothetical protein [Moritella sp.]NQZ92094.1 hypothetical protein [Moritella sp.]